MDLLSTEPGSGDPIRSCRRLLGRRDFFGCRNRALKALRSQPNSPELAQILAIVDVLLAAQRRDFNERPDYYSILQLTRLECDSGPAVLNQSKKLMLVLSPSRNKFPFSDEALRLVCEAWSVLSKPEKKKKYDLEITNDGNGENSVGNCGNRGTHLTSNAARGEDDKGKRKKGTLSKRERKDETFWTVCPYCCVLYEYAVMYKESCLRCQNCWKAFHGMSVGPLPASLVAEGVDEYQCGLGFFQFGYNGDGFFVSKENNGCHDDDAGRVNSAVEKSDDGDHKAENAKLENDEKGVKSGEAKKETKKREGVVLGRLNGKRVKTTAKNTSKGMRMAMKKMKKTEPSAGEKSCGNDNVGDPKFSMED